MTFEPKILSPAVGPIALGGKVDDPALVAGPAEVLPNARERRAIGEALGEQQGHDARGVVGMGVENLPQRPAQEVPLHAMKVRLVPAAAGSPEVVDRRQGRGRKPSPRLPLTDKPRSLALGVAYVRRIADCDQYSFLALDAVGFVG